MGVLQRFGDAVRETALEGDLGSPRPTLASGRMGLISGRSGRARLPAVAARPGVWVSALFLLLLVLAAVLAPWITPYGAEGAGMPNMAHRLQAPSWAHPFGADEMGRDLLARVLYGARTSLALAALVVGSSVLIGIVVGLAAGAAGGWLDEAAMRLTDVFLAFPPLLLAILVAAVLQGGFTSAVLALVLVWWPVYAILVRGQVAALRHRPFVEAARAIGATSWGIAWRHLLPNAVGPLLVQATIDIGAVILVASGLSFIGLGPHPPAADWGAMVNNGRPYVLGGAWWLAGIPALAILLTALACAVLGDSLRESASPNR